MNMMRAPKMMTRTAEETTTDTTTRSFLGAALHWGAAPVVNTVHSSLQIVKLPFYSHHHDVRLWNWHFLDGYDTYFVPLWVKKKKKSNHHTYNLFWRNEQAAFTVSELVFWQKRCVTFNSLIWNQKWWQRSTARIDFNEQIMPVMPLPVH